MVTTVEQSSPNILAEQHARKGQKLHPNVASNNKSAASLSKQSEGWRRSTYCLAVSKNPQEREVCPHKEYSLPHPMGTTQKMLSKVVM